MNDGVMNRMHSSATWRQKVKFGGLEVGPAGRERNKPMYLSMYSTECWYARSRIMIFDKQKPSDLVLLG